MHASACTLVVAVVLAAALPAGLDPLSIPPAPPSAAETHQADVRSNGDGSATLRIAPQSERRRSLSALMLDPRTIWYDAQTLPQAFVLNGQLVALGTNQSTFPGQEDATGSANNEHPWLHTGGLDECGPQVHARRLLWVPPGEKIKVRLRERTIDSPGKKRRKRFVRAEGEFPVGTTVAELLYEADRLFEIRARTKTDDGWDTEQIGIGEPPAGYREVDNCVECHEDVGRHSEDIDHDRDWYGVVRGLEPGGPMHWHPFDTEGLGQTGIRLRLRNDVRHFVEWER